MKLGTEVGLGPGYIVLGGDPVPHKGVLQFPPIFGPCLLWPNGWMDQDTTLYGSRLIPGDIVLDGDPAAAPPKKSGGTEPRQFWPMSIVAKRLHGSR